MQIKQSKEWIAVAATFTGMVQLSHFNDWMFVLKQKFPTQILHGDHANFMLKACVRPLHALLHQQ